MPHAHRVHPLLRSATKLASDEAGVLATMRGAPQASESQAVSQYSLSCCASSCDRGVAVLGLFVSFVGRSAGACSVRQRVLRCICAEMELPIAAGTPM